jgi:hypothetical protein
MQRSTRAAVGLSMMFLLAPIALLITPMAPASEPPRGCMDALELVRFEPLDLTPYVVAGLVALLGLLFVLGAILGPDGEPMRPAKVRLAACVGLLVVAAIAAALVPCTHVIAIVAAVAGVAFVASSFRRDPVVPPAIVVTTR